MVALANTRRSITITIASRRTGSFFSRSHLSSSCHLLVEPPDTSQNETPSRQTSAARSLGLWHEKTIGVAFGPKLTHLTGV